MFGMGMPEILLILAIALIVIGPKKLPDLAKSLGRAMIEFKKATSELKASLEVDTDVTDVKKTFKDMDQVLKKTIDVTPQKPEVQTPAAQKGDLPADTAPVSDPRTTASAPDFPASSSPPSEDGIDAGGGREETKEMERAAKDDA